MESRIRMFLLVVVLLDGSHVSDARCLDPVEHPTIYQNQTYRPRFHMSYWDSHTVVHYVLKILATEIFGYNCIIVQDSNWAESIMIGIQQDKWDIDIESWRITGTMLRNYADYAVSAGPIGYPAVSGPHVINANQGDEFSKVLENYKAYYGSTGIDALPAGGTIPGNSNCTQIWCKDQTEYVTPPCVANKSTCGTYCLPSWAYLGTNGQLFRNLDLNITLSFRSDVPSLASTYNKSGKPLMFYWWSPTREVANYKAKLVRLPSFNRQQWLTADRDDCCAATSVIASAWDQEIIYKIVSKKLETQAAALTALIRGISLGVDQIDHMLTMIPAGSSGSFSPDAESVACDWLKANVPVWSLWMPDLYCESNHYPDPEDDNVCKVCPAGKDSLPGFGGECKDCTPGTYSWRAGESCVPCPMGSYQPESGAQTCVQCPSSASRILDNCNIDTTFCIPDSISHCICDPGTYKSVSADLMSFTCEDCPTTELAYEVKTSAQCDGGSTLPYSKENFWAHPDDPSTFFKCTSGLCDSGHPECWGDSSDPDRVGARPGYPLCVGTLHQAATLSACKGQNKGNMCAQCEDGAFKYNAGCYSCPPVGVGVFLYPLAPLFWVFVFFPCIKHLIGQKITPSLFVSLPFLQLTAVIGSFGFVWPDVVKSTLSLFKVVNFDVNLAFFDCWMGDSFLFKFLFIECMPVMYGLRYFGEHYWTVWKRRGQMTAEQQYDSWNHALHNVVFLVNMLYISLATQVLNLYSCVHVNDDLYVMTSNNGVTCFEGDHLIALGISVVPLLLYVIGWPLAIAGIFYVAHVKLLLNNPKYTAMYGFLYKRYEAQWYWWHIFIVGDKLAFVLVNAFLFQDFMQGPLAMVIVFVFILLQAFATPFESTVLDRLMVMAQTTLFLEILVGILFCTELGKGSMEDALIALTFIFVFGCLMGIILFLYRDVQRHNIQHFLTWAGKGQDCPIKPVIYVQNTLASWVATAPKEQWELLAEFESIRSEHKCPDHLADPLLFMVKGAPELLDLVLFSPPVEANAKRAQMGERICFEMAKRHDGDQVIRRCAEDRVPIEQSLWSLVMWFKGSLTVNYCTDPEPTTELVKKDTGNKLQLPEDMVPAIFKEAQWGMMFWFLSHCSFEHQVVCIRCFLMLATKKVWSMEEVNAALRRLWSLELGILQLQAALRGAQVRAMMKDCYKIDVGGIIVKPDSEPDSPMCLDDNSIKTINPLIEESHPNGSGERKTAPIGCKADPADDREDSSPRDEIYVRMFGRYDLDCSGSINAPEELEMLTTNLLMAPRFKGIATQHPDRAQAIERAQSELKASMEHAKSRASKCTVEVFVNWFEATFLRHEQVRLLDAAV